MPASSYTSVVPAVEFESTTPAYETGDYPLRLRWQIGRGSGTRTHGSGFGDRQCSRFAYSPISKSNEKPRPEPRSDGKSSTQTPKTRLPK